MTEKSEMETEMVEGERSISGMKHAQEHRGNRQMRDPEWLLAAKKAVALLPMGTKGTAWFFMREAEKVAGPSPYGLPNNFVHSCVIDGVLSKTGRIAPHRYRRANGKSVTHNGPEYMRGTEEPTNHGQAYPQPAPSKNPWPQEKFGMVDELDQIRTKLDELAQIKLELRDIRNLLERHFK